MKKNKKFEKWALTELKKLRTVLLLEDFTPLSIEPSGKKNTSECEVAYPYKSITIKYSEQVLDDFLKNKKENAIQVLTHEMCHPITDGLYTKASNRFVSKDEIEDERERLTDHIANILLKKNERR